MHTPTTRRRSLVSRVKRQTLLSVLDKFLFIVPLFRNAPIKPYNIARKRPGLRRQEFQFELIPEAPQPRKPLNIAYIIYITYVLRMLAAYVCRVCVCGLLKTSLPRSYEDYESRKWRASPRVHLVLAYVLYACLLHTKFQLFFGTNLCRMCYYVVNFLQSILCVKRIFIAYTCAMIFNHFII